MFFAKCSRYFDMIYIKSKFTYSHLGRALEKQKKTNEEQEKKPKKKQVEALEVLKPNTQQLTIKDVIQGNTLTEELNNKS